MCTSAVASVQAFGLGPHVRESLCMGLLHPCQRKRETRRTIDSNRFSLVIGRGRCKL